MSGVRIVVLDGFTLNPGDISWEPLKALGQLDVYDRSGELAARRAHEAEVVLTNKDPIGAELIRQLPNLRYIGVLATGTNIVDLQAARQHDIPVTNVPGYGAPAVAQHVFALLLELVNHTSSHTTAVRKGRWNECPDFCFTIDTITELADKTLGIVGVGAIGARVARIASAFGMRIVAAHQRSKDQENLDGVSIQWVDVDRLFEISDVVTLHCPLTDETNRLVNAERLSRMKPTAYLINTGRGALVDEQALRDALSRGNLAGAGLDVLSTEPPVDGNILTETPRCIVTPHIAWATREARQRLMKIAADNVSNFLKGNPTHVVN